MSQVCTRDRKRCHLSHGSLNMWWFYTVIYWRGYYTVDAILVKRQVNFQRSLILDPKLFCLGACQCFSDQPTVCPQFGTDCLLMTALFSLDYTSPSTPWLHPIPWYHLIADSQIPQDQKILCSRFPGWSWIIMTLSSLISTMVSAQVMLGWVTWVTWCLLVQSSNRGRNWAFPWFITSPILTLPSRWPLS